MAAETAAPWALDPYANAVVDVLREDFPDLCHPDVASLVRKHVYLYVRAERTARTPQRLEVILDDPIRAKWRLVNRDGRLRVACWRVEVPDADQELADRVNAALNALGVGSDSEEG
jgi:hypothetical protein